MPGDRGSAPAISAENCSGAHLAGESEGLSVTPDPFARGLAATGVVVVGPRRHLLLVVAMLAQRDLADRKHDPNLAIRANSG